MGHEFSLYLFWIGIRFVDLIDCDNDLNTRSTRVVEGLNGLRHHAVVCRDNQDHDVSDLCPSRTHCCECFVAWSVDEGEKVFRRD